MTGPDLDAAQALTDAATEGPWDSWRSPTEEGSLELAGVHRLGHSGQLVGIARTYRGDRDAAFIAWARTGVPQLIARVRGLERIVSAIQDLHASDSHPSLPCCPECLVPWPCKTGTTVRQNSTGQHSSPARTRG